MFRLIRTNPIGLMKPCIVVPDSKRFQCDYKYYQAGFAEKCGDSYTANLFGVCVKTEVRKVFAKRGELSALAHEMSCVSQSMASIGKRTAPATLPEELSKLNLPVVSPSTGVKDDEVRAGISVMHDAIIQHPDGHFEVKQISMLTEKGGDLYGEYCYILAKKGKKAAAKYFDEYIRATAEDEGAEVESEDECMETEEV
ncbi:MAG: hypothetical protein LBC41_13180 [Clostridiales bacterium]|nr:hypothetical protein [Clostridiales bacterium]